MLKPHRSRESQHRRLLVVGAVAFMSWFCMESFTQAGSTSPIEQLMALTGLLDHASAAMDPVIGDLRAKNPDVPPALWDNYAARINDHSALVRLYAPIYRRHVPSEDTRQLVAFFQYPMEWRDI